MLVVLASHQCFHCVEVDAFQSDRAIADRAESLYGTPCPLCGRVVRLGDLTVIVDRASEARIAQGAVVWDSSADRPARFEDFLSAGSGTHRSTALAGKLRDQLAAGPADQRRQRCELASGLLVGGKTTIVVVKGALEAEEDGDHERELRAYRAIVEYSTSADEREAAKRIQDGVLIRRADPAAAAELFRTTTPVAAGHLWTVARYLHARVLEDAGDLDSARRVLRECVERGDGYAQAKAAVHLGSLLRSSPDEERRLLEPVLSYEDPELSAVAALTLGTMALGAADIEQAFERWQYAFAQGSKGIRAIAAFNLGEIFAGGGRAAQAREYYTIALESSKPNVVATARERLRRLG